MHKHAFPLLRLKAMSLTIVESSFLLMLTDTSVHIMDCNHSNLQCFVSPVQVQTFDNANLNIILLCCCQMNMFPITLQVKHGNNKFLYLQKPCYNTVM